MEWNKCAFLHCFLLIYILLMTCHVVLHEWTFASVEKDNVCFFDAVTETRAWKKIMSTIIKVSIFSASVYRTHI
jgi:hypothetical protein